MNTLADLSEPPLDGKYFPLSHIEGFVQGTLRGDNGIELLVKEGYGFPKALFLKVKTAGRLEGQYSLIPCFDKVNLKILQIAVEFLKNNPFDELRLNGYYPGFRPHLLYGELESDVSQFFAKTGCTATFKYCAFPLGLVANIALKRSDLETALVTHEAILSGKEPRTWNQLIDESPILTEEGALFPKIYLKEVPL